MNWIDAVVLVVWAITAFWGYRSGLVQITIPLVVVIVGLAVSSRLAPDVGDVFSGFTENEDIQTIAGFVLIFFVLVVAGALAGFTVRTVLRVIPLFGLANSLGGMVAGLLIGFLILSGVLIGVQKYPFDNIEQHISDSTLGTFLADNSDVVIHGTKLVPSDWRDRLDRIPE